MSENVGEDSSAGINDFYFSEFIKSSGMDTLLTQAKTVYNKPGATDAEKLSALQQIEDLFDISWIDAPVYTIGEAYRPTPETAAQGDDGHIGCIVIPNGEYAGLKIILRRQPPQDEAKANAEVIPHLEQTTAFIIRDPTDEQTIFFPIEDNDLLYAKFDLPASEAIRDDFAGILSGYAKRVQRYVTGKTFLAKSLEKQKIEIERFITTIESAVGRFQQQGRIRLEAAMKAADGEQPIPEGDSFQLFMPDFHERTEPYRTPDDISGDNALSCILTDSKTEALYVAALTDIQALLDPATGKNAFIDPSEVFEEPVDIRHMFREPKFRALIETVEADVAALEDSNDVSNATFNERCREHIAMLNGELPRYLLTALMHAKGPFYDIEELPEDSEEEPKVTIWYASVDNARFGGFSIEFIDGKWRVGCVLEYLADGQTEQTDASTIVFVIPRRLEQFIAVPPQSFNASVDTKEEPSDLIAKLDSVDPSIFDTMQADLADLASTVNRDCWNDREFRLMPASVQIQELESACDTIQLLHEDEIPAKQDFAECLLTKFVRIPLSDLTPESILSPPSFTVPEGDVAQGEIAERIVKGRQACIVIPELVFGTFELSRPLKRSDFVFSDGLPMLYIETDTHAFFAPLDHVHELSAVNA